MFLNTTRRRNPDLMRAAVKLHQAGDIPPNTYLIDLDTVADNTRLLANEAAQYGVKLYFMSKQVGRVPAFARWVAEHGIPQAVAVDVAEARILSEAGVRLGHVGHLVQPGRSEWGDILRLKPEVVTVFSLTRARQLSMAAERLGCVQPVLLRVVRSGDTLYPGQYGGFKLEELSAMLPELQRLPGIRIVGVTSFPVLLMDGQKHEMQLTPNAETLLLAKQALAQAGIRVTQINGPSGTSCTTIPLLHRAGITHGEPGHALTGTTPLHAMHPLPERPAIVYVTEVSHRDDDDIYVIGGGFYTRSHVAAAAVSNRPADIVDNILPAAPLSPENIDYYGALKPERDVQAGDTAVYAFRTQIFVTRAHVALIRGVREGQPEIVHLQRRG